MVVNIDIYPLEVKTRNEAPLYQGISAGFPSPATDYLDIAIDLNRELIKNPSSTFFGRVKGLSMKDAGIDEDDILIIDKSLKPRNGMMAVCFINGEFTLKKILISGKTITLMPANDLFLPLIVTDDSDFLVWGIVTYVIKKIR